MQPKSSARLLDTLRPSNEKYLRAPGPLDDQICDITSETSEPARDPFAVKKEPEALLADKGYDAERNPEVLHPLNLKSIKRNEHSMQRTKDKMKRAAAMSLRHEF